MELCARTSFSRSPLEIAALDPGTNTFWSTSSAALVQDTRSSLSPIGDSIGRRLTGIPWDPANLYPIGDAGWGSGVVLANKENQLGDVHVSGSWTSFGGRWSPEILRGAECTQALENAGRWYGSWPFRTKINPR